MIDCPKCGSANREGSSFCAACGQELEAGNNILCQQCGAANPPYQLFCTACDARLLPAGAVSSDDIAVPGTSEPLQPAGPFRDEPSEELGADIAAEAEDDTPAWLQSLRAAPISEAPDLSAEEDDIHAPGSMDALVGTPSEQSGDEGGDLADSDGAKTDAPEWLQGLAESLAEQGEGSEETLAETEPAWASESMADSDDAVTEEAAGPQPEFEATEVDDTMPAPPQPAEREDLAAPDWLSSLRPEPAEEHEDTAELSPGDEHEPMPDWLAELRPGASEEAPETHVSAEKPGEDAVPDWLLELQPAAQEEEEAPDSLAHATEVEEQEAPDWLSELQPRAVAEAETDSPPATIGAGAEPDLPLDWETDAVVDEPTGPEPPAFALDSDRIEPTEEPQILGENAPLQRAMPDWVAGSQPDSADELAQPMEDPAAEAALPDWLVPSQPDVEQETLARAEIPDWLLALKPRELDEAQEQVEGRAAQGLTDTGEETGLLAGLQGTLPVEMAIAQPRTIRAERPLQLPVADSPQAQIFADVVARPSDAESKQVETATEWSLGRLPRWLIYASLIIVMVVPLLIGRPLLGRTAEPPAMVADLHGVIQALDETDSVLVAFDYDPSTSDEMNLLANALIGHLMDRGVTLVAVSLMPAGPATAESVLDEQAASRPTYAEKRNQRYTNLGYLPGQVAGVRLLSLSWETALSESFDGEPIAELAALEGLANLQDFALILELAATQDTLRWWIEQASTPSGVPLAAAVSASAAPLARPYYMTAPRQVVGLLGGVPDVATYEALLEGQEGLTNASGARLDAQLAGHLLFMLVLVLGNVAYLLRGRGRR